MDTATTVSTTQNLPPEAEKLMILNAGCGCEGTCGCGSVRTQPVAEQACDCGCITQAR